MTDEHRTLEELDGENWGEPETAPTPMVARCLRLRRTPLHLLSQGDLRLLISQKIGLKYTVPEAMRSISENAMLEAEYYPGDLLCALLRIDKDDWSPKSAELNWLMSVAQSVAKQYGEIVGKCESFLAAKRPSCDAPLMAGSLTAFSSTFPKFELYWSVTTTNNNRHSGARVTREARNKRARNP